MIWQQCVPEFKTSLKYNNRLGYLQSRNFIHTDLLALNASLLRRWSRKEVL